MSRATSKSYSFPTWCIDINSKNRTLSALTCDSSNATTVLVKNSKITTINDFSKTGKVIFKSKLKINTIEIYIHYIFVAVVMSISITVVLIVSSIGVLLWQLKNCWKKRRIGSIEVLYHRSSGVSFDI